MALFTKVPCRGVEFEIMARRARAGDILSGIKKCRERGLLHSCKWLSEVLFTLEDEKPDDESMKSALFSEPPEIQAEVDVAEERALILAKSYFDLKEYDRCAHFSKPLKSSKGSFLHWYSRYLSGEKKRIEDMPESNMTAESMNLEHLTDLKDELGTAYKNDSLDPFCLYLYGIVLKKLRVLDDAHDMLLEAVKLEPTHWGAWLELAGLIESKEELVSLDVPDSWIKRFFVAHSLLEMQRNEEALDMYDTLRSEGFAKSIYISAQIAMAFHNMRDTDSAMTAFNEVIEADPMRLELMDVYSNVLYVREMRVQLAHLAQRANEIDKYKPETCCIIGNYYGLRQQHEKAVVYFQRALKLNPGFLAAWTLMGHEYMEMKNTNAAIQCYRQALEISTRDYRAWYGLGQTYEHLKLHQYSLHYYRQAAVLRPNDSRMAVALGDIYEKLDRLDEATKCYWKAHCLGDIEAIALQNLARLYEKQKDKEKAADAYLAYLKLLDPTLENESPSVQQLEAELYLARFFMEKGKFEDAYTYAQACVTYPECREPAKAILKEITQERAKLEDSMMMDESIVIASGDPADLI